MGYPQQEAFEALKKAHRICNLEEKVTLQCDVSLSRLGAVLIQNGQPVGYASRALTLTESK